MPERLFHFSDRGDIEVFVPRAPLRHPDAEPLVYAIDAWHSPLYFFPRDCPRIVLWPTPETSQEDLAWFRSQTSGQMLGFIQKDLESEWRATKLFRYEFDLTAEFEYTGDIGVWVSRQTTHPAGLGLLTDLPFLAEQHGLEIEVVESLIDTASRFYDFESRQFRTTLHVSMIRISAMPDWPLPPVKPAWTNEDGSP